MATLVKIQVPCTVRFDPGLVPVLKAWLGGVEVRPAQAVEIPAGTMPFVAAVMLADPSEQLLVCPTLHRASGGEPDIAAWKAFMQRVRPHLEKAVRYCPETLVGRKAKVILDADR